MASPRRTRQRAHTRKVGGTGVSHSASAGSGDPVLPLEYLEEAALYLVRPSDGFVFGDDDLQKVRIYGMSASTSDPSSDSPTVVSVNETVDLVREIAISLFEGAVIRLENSDEAESDGRPFTIRVEYSVGSLDPDTAWERHAELLRRYVERVPYEQRQKFALYRVPVA